MQKKNVIEILVNNSLNTCGATNNNVNSKIFKYLTKKILTPRII